MPKTEKRKCLECNKEVIVSEGIEKYNPKTMKYDANGDLYKTKRCADCGTLFELHRTRTKHPKQQTEDKRPKIPLKPIGETESGCIAFLWFFSIVTLFLGIFRVIDSMIFFIILGIYSFLVLRQNITFCFQKKYLLKSLLYLPLLYIPKLLCEQALRYANISWLNFSISLRSWGSEALGTQYVTDWVTFFLVLAFFMFLMVSMNYYEEWYFRKSWYLVPIWALLHLVLGFSNFSVGEFIILLGMGVAFKLIYDKDGIEVSYPTHLFINFATVFVALILALVLGI
jgi:hypothetical protein